MQTLDSSFIDVTKKIIIYAYEKKFSYDYMISIGCPKEIFNQNIQIDSQYILLCDWIDEISEKCHLHIMNLLFEDKLFETISEVRNSKLLYDLNLPLCDFWLEFLELVKENFLRCEMQFTKD